MSEERIPIGLQLWSVREDCGKDLKGTLTQLKQMGYEAVELAGTYEMTADQWKQMLDDLGLQIAGAHSGLPTVMGDELEKTLAFYKAIGTDSVIVPALGGEYRESIDAYKRAAEIISTAAVKAADFGMQIGYHNHDFEFKVVDGQVPYDVLLANFDNRVLLQYDFGWLYRAGADGAAYVRNFPGRQKTVHIKAFDPDNETAVVGEDSVPWGQVFEACETVGKTAFYIVEHERYADAPLVCVKQCIDNLRAMM